MSENKYVTIWRNKWITANANSIDDFIETFEQLAKLFRKWKALGITLNHTGGVADDYAEFITDNMDVAIEAGFTFCQGNDKTTAYLETEHGEFVEVPPEKLKK